MRFARCWPHLSKEAVDCVLSEALAIAVPEAYRLAEDIDLFVRPAPDNVDRFRGALPAGLGSRSFDEIGAASLAGEGPAVQYIASDGTARGILALLGTVFALEDLQVAVHSCAKVNVEAPSPETLCRMKRDTVRPRERADATGGPKEKFESEESRVGARKFMTPERAEASPWPESPCPRSGRHTYAVENCSDPSHGRRPGREFPGPTSVDPSATSNNRGGDHGVAGKDPPVS